MKNPFTLPSESSEDSESSLDPDSESEVVTLSTTETFFREERIFSLGVFLRLELFADRDLDFFPFDVDPLLFRAGVRDLEDLSPCCARQVWSEWVLTS